jgi:hypothetical protein
VKGLIQKPIEVAFGLKRPLCYMDFEALAVFNTAYIHVGSQYLV